LILSLLQLADVANAAVSAGGALACIALVRVDDRVQDFEVRPLSPPAAERALAAARFGVATEPREATIFERLVGGHETAPTAADAAPMVARLADDIRCVDLRVGRRLLADGTSGRRLLDELLDVR
jgi:hypothetical protein